MSKLSSSLGGYLAWEHALSLLSVYTSCRRRPKNAWLQLRGCREKPCASARSRERGARLERSPSQPFFGRHATFPQKSGERCVTSKKRLRGKLLAASPLARAFSRRSPPSPLGTEIFLQATYWRKMGSLARPFLFSRVLFVAPSNVCHTGYTCSIYFSFSWELH